MIELIKKEIKFIERHLRQIKKGKYRTFEARRNGKNVKVKFRIKPVDKFMEGKLEAYKGLLEATLNTSSGKVGK